MDVYKFEQTIEFQMAPHHYKGHNVFKCQIKEYP